MKYPIQSEAPPKFPGSRTLHLIDVENLCGVRPGLVERSQAVMTLHAYRQAADIRSADTVLVGCGPHPVLAFACQEALPAARLRTRPGPDGGENVVLDQVTATLLERYDRLVIGSGDGQFTAVSRKFRAWGGEVLVVAEPGCVARDLLGSATSFHPLPVELSWAVAA